MQTLVLQQQNHSVSKEVKERHLKQLICSSEFALHVGIPRNAPSLGYTGNIPALTLNSASREILDGNNPKHT